MGKVTSRFFITTIQDGQTITAELVSSIKLVQNISGGACVPNWNEGETDVVNPVVYVYSRLNGTVTPPMQASDKWYWNDIEIQWNGSNKSSNVTDAAGYPVFQKTTYQYSQSLSLPAIKIIRNLANATYNTNNDVISFKGAMDLGGPTQEFGVDTIVRISEIAGTGYTAVCGGDTDVTSNNSAEAGYTATVYGILYAGTNPVTGLTSVQAFREGIDTSQPFATCTVVASQKTTSRGTIIPASSYEMTINAAQITDRCVLRFDFYKEGEKVASAWTDVDDNTDSEELYVVNSIAETVGMNEIQMRTRQTCTIKCWMGYSTDMYKRHTNPTYNSFKCMLTDAQGKVITSGGPIQGHGTPDAQGFFSITSEHVTITDQSTTLLAEGLGGLLDINGSDVASAGGGMGGVILAEVVVNS